MADDGPVSARLSDEEFLYLLQLLRRYAETDLDQWDNWRLDTEHGRVFVLIMLRPPPGVPEDAFGEMRIPAAERYRTGRFARTGDPGEVTSGADLARLVGEMSAGLAGGGAAEWENATLGRFLGALPACFGGRQDAPSWAAFAQALVTATGYE